MPAKEFDSFDLKPFLRTLSYREFLTSLTTVLILLAGVAIKTYLTGFTSHTTVRIFIPVCFFIGHIVYRVEHRRSNRFIGRFILDIVSLLLFLLLSQILIDDNSTFFPEEQDMIFIFFLILILIGVFEFLVSLFRKLLNSFGWQIL